MGYPWVKLCPCCGQDIVVSNEITSLRIRPGPLQVLMRLVRAKSCTLTYEQLGHNRPTLHVYISQLRAALHETGSPWSIKTDYSIGYYAVRTKEHDSDNPPERQEALHS
jgi:hypothetical protein